MSGSDDEKVGYCHPPRSGQFRKGVSGNPKGRPRKQVANAALHPANYPTRHLLRAGAARTITVTDGGERRNITVNEAIIRALEVNALRGGVLAQRFWLTLQMAENERYRNERQERFDHWHDYRERMRLEIDRASQEGNEIPHPLPHPSDIKLDFATLEVEIVGPVEPEELATLREMADLRDLCFHLSIFYNEPNRLPDNRADEGEIGIFMLCFWSLTKMLPPSLRTSTDTLCHEVTRGATSRISWARELEMQCRTLNLPLQLPRDSIKMPAYPCSLLGVEWRDGQLEWKKFGRGKSK